MAKMRSAFAMTAPWITLSPTPPRPKTATVEPGRSDWRRALTKDLSGLIVTRDTVPTWSGWVRGDRQTGPRTFSFRALEWGSFFRACPAKAGEWTEVNDHVLFRDQVAYAQSIAGQNVQVQLVGDSTQVLAELADGIIPVLSGRKELRDVRVDTGDENAELAISVDRERALTYGFSAEEVARYVGIALRGTPLREFRRGETEVPVWVRFDGAEEFGVEDLSGLTLRTPGGGSSGARC